MSGDVDIKRLTIEWTKAQPSVARFIRSFIVNQAEADDLLQEVALVIVDRFESYDIDQPFIGWALGVSRRVVWNHLRKKYRENDLTLSLAVENVSTVFEELDSHAEEMKDALAKCLKRVDQAGTNILKLRYEEGMSVKQVASQLGKTRNSVGVLLHRIRVGLRNCIKHQLLAEGGK